MTNLRIESASPTVANSSVDTSSAEFAQVSVNAWGNDWQRGGTHSSIEAATDEAIRVVTTSSYPLVAVVAEKDRNPLEAFTGKPREYQVFYYDLNNQPHLTREERAAEAIENFDEDGYTLNGVILPDGVPIRPTL